MLCNKAAEYTRQLTTWTELNHKSHNFLQLNGILLSVIFIGIGITKDILDIFTLMLSAISSCLIIISILILAKFVTPATTIKEIRVDLEGDVEVKNKEVDIMLSLIKQYNIAQKDIISKYKDKEGRMEQSIKFLIGGLLSLLVFLFMIFFQKSVSDIPNSFL